MATTVFDKPLDKSVGTLSSLTTTAKTDLVSAVNEVKGNVGKFLGNGSTVASFADAFSLSVLDKITAAHVTQGAADAPNSTGYWDVIQGGANSEKTYGWQIAAQTNTNNMYIRRKYSGTWYSWEKLALDSNTVHTSDIVDNLTDTSTTKVLSANQGKVLKDSLSTIDKYITYNNIIEGGGTGALSFTLPAGSASNSESLYLLFVGLRGYRVFNSQSDFAVYLVGGGGAYASYVTILNNANYTLTVTKGSPNITVSISRASGNWGNSLITAHRIN